MLVGASRIKPSTLLHQMASSKSGPIIKKPILYL